MFLPYLGIDSIEAFCHPSPFKVSRYFGEDSHLQKLPTDELDRHPKPKLWS